MRYEEESKLLHTGKDAIITPANKRKTGQKVIIKSYFRQKLNPKP
jgi:hypothetical protein